METIEIKGRRITVQQEVENKDERKEKKKEDGSDARRGGSYHRSEGKGGVCRDSRSAESIGGTKYWNSGLRVKERGW